MVNDTQLLHQDDLGAPTLTVHIVRGRWLRHTYLPILRMQSPKGFRVSGHYVQ